MKTRPREFYKSIKGKRVYFLGAGLSHRELIPRFAKEGAVVSLCDKKDREALGALADEYDALGVELRLGESYLKDLTSADIVFRSPGIDYTKKEIQEAVAAGVEVTSEIEKFFELCPARTVGITGSDGKTTTTSLTARILEKAGYRVFLGGNIGVPMLPLVEELAADDIAVVELSSFQLISMRGSPDYALVTNLSPNHLDHHKDMQEYIDAKRNILLHQSERGEAVLFLDNDITRAMAGDTKGCLRWFSREQAVENGAYTEGDILYIAADGKNEALFDLRELKLLGDHNRTNAAAAAALTMTLADKKAFVEAASEFRGVEHRLEFVRELGGAKWYNDSIGTSPTRTIAGLKSFERQVILIAGGYDKKISYAPLAPEIIKHVKHLLLCGATGPVIRRETEEAGGTLPIEDCESLEKAVKRAREISGEGDIILFSPASASFDLYKNFEERGEHFKRLVGELK